MTELLTGLSDTAAIHVEYTEIPPVAVNDNSTGNVPGAAVTINVLSNDDLSDGSNTTPATVSVDLDPATAGIQDTLTVVGQGEWTYNSGTGEVTFTPQAGYTTDPTDISYVLTELLTGLSDTAAIHVEYTEIPPVAVNDNSTGNVPGAAVTINVLSNDDLSDGSNTTPATVSVDLDPATAGIQDTLTVVGQGEWTYNTATGEVTFTPQAGYTTDPTDISYVLTELLTGLSDTAAIHVEYTEIPPVAVNDNSTGNVPGAAVTINVLSNDDLSDGSNTTPATVSVDLDPGLSGIQSSLTVSGEGQWVYNSTNGQVTFTPESSFTIDPSDIIYRLIENLTGLSSLATISVNYNERPPFAVNDNDLDNSPASTVTLNILANDDLSDGTPASTSTVLVDLTPGTPVIDNNLTVVGEGTYNFNAANGNITFTPSPGFTNDPTPIQYVLVETLTTLKDTATITITYVPIIPENDTSLANTPGMPVVINIISNDTLSDGNPATPLEVIIDLNPVTPGIDTTISIPGEGTWVYDPLTGDLTFTPEPGFVTDPTPVTYEVSEISKGIKRSAVVTIDYSPAVYPVAMPDSSLGNMPFVIASLNVLSNDTLSTGLGATPVTANVDLTPLTLSIDDTLIVAGEGTFVYNSSNGVLSFEPESGFIGNPSSIQYVLIENVGGLKDTASINITYLLPVDAISVASSTTLPGINATVNIVSNDTLSDGSPATPLEVIIDLDMINPGVQSMITVSGEGVWSYDSTSGLLTFNPETGFTKDPTPVYYQLTEKTSGLSDTAYITMIYTELPPVALDDNSFDNSPASAVILNVLLTDSLSDGTVAVLNKVSVDLNPATPFVENTINVVGEGVYTYNGLTGYVTFTPESGFTDNPTPIQYVLVENLTGLKDTATITITYVPLVPENDQSVGNTPGVPVVINIIENDTLSDGNPATPVEVSIDLNPATPGIDTTLTVPGEGVWEYDPLTGELTFTPEPGFITNPTPITYGITEISKGQSRTATVVIAYGPASPPIAINDSDLNNMPFVIGSVNVLANDTLSSGLNATPATANVDLNLSTPIIESSLVIPGEGSFVYDTLTGIVTFNPESGFTGNPAPIQYVLTEIATGLKDTATITYTYLLPVIAMNDTSLGNVPGVNTILNIISNDLLSDGNPAPAAEVVVDMDPASPGDQSFITVSGQGTWTYNSGSGQLTFGPTPGFSTDPTDINYIIRETATGLADTAIVHVTYIEIPPIANPDNSLNNQPQTVVNINILTDDRLSDGSLATTGTTTIDLEPFAPGITSNYIAVGEGLWSYSDVTGVLRFTPIPGFYNNPTPLVYSLTEDGTGLSDTATVVITNFINPGLELIKNGTLIGDGYLGDSIRYSFTVINTGNVPVFNILINDSRISASSIALSPTSLSPGGMGVAQFTYPLTMSDILAGTVNNSAIVSGNSINAIVVTDTSDNGDPMLPGDSNPTVTALPTPVVDVDLTSSVLGTCSQAIGDTVTFRFKVARRDTVAVLNNVSIADSISSSFDLISYTASEGTYDTLSGQWTGISLAAGDSAILTLRVRILTNIGGLACMDAWVVSSTFGDTDSNPGDKVINEDDITRACVTVPLVICPEKSETIELAAGSGYTTYQWYRNGTLISGATSPTYIASQGGTYTIIVDGSGCASSTCCPIIVQEVCACPPQICVPITVRKIR
ncbi:MAG: hypothetical protein U0V04_09660 [Spirosomataceae bacterium]